MPKTLEQTRQELAAAKEQMERLERELAEREAAEQIKEPTKEGTVITYQRRYRSGDPYTFAAILLAGDWFTTGTRTKAGEALVWETIVARAVPGSIVRYDSGTVL